MTPDAEWIREMAEFSELEGEGDGAYEFWSEIAEAEALLEDGTGRKGGPML